MRQMMRRLNPGRASYKIFESYLKRRAALHQDYRAAVTAYVAVNWPEKSLSSSDPQNATAWLNSPGREALASQKKTIDDLQAQIRVLEEQLQASSSTQVEADKITVLHEKLEREIQAFNENIRLLIRDLISQLHELFAKHLYGRILWMIKETARRQKF